MHTHLFGGMVHFLYLLLFSIYTVEVYMYRDFTNRAILCWLMLLTLIYPMVYDFMQLKKIGPQ